MSLRTISSGSKPNDAAIIADTDLHQEARTRVLEVLRKAVTAPRDREF